jgi:putative hydrolase of the HAD superfamily
MDPARAAGTTIPLPWDRIATVLLDMDGTLLDLRYDNHFWLEHVPRRYAEARGLPLAAARAELLERYRRAEGTLDWYCVDYWSRELGLDIPLLKEEVDHLIAVHPHVIGFLEAVRVPPRRSLLVTNAHGASIGIKFRRTPLAAHFDRVVSAHDLGVPKEDPDFWRRLAAVEPFDPARTLLVDDSLAVLRSARAFGVARLLAVRRPDSGQPERAEAEFPAIDDFRQIMPP